MAALSGAAWWYGTSQTVHSATGIDLGRPLEGVGPDGLNLLVITLDTARADRIGAYGAAGVQTPAIDRLAREGVLFEQTTAPAPLTLPAHCSIFTGRLPAEHGVRDNGGFFLGPEQTTLARLLRARGFSTGAVVGAYVLDGKWGLNQGFDAYVDDFDLSTEEGGLSIASVQRRGDEVVDRALPWLEKVRDKRFFAWLHFYDPHTPYDPPEPFKTRYATHPYNGEIAFVDAQVGRVIAFLEQQRPARSDDRRGGGRSRREPRRPRRGGARLLHLREHRPCAVRDPRPADCDVGRSPSHGPCPRRSTSSPRSSTCSACLRQQAYRAPASCP